jgi:hypothetical protein
MDGIEYPDVTRRFAEVGSAAAAAAAAAAAGGAE